ncbi:MAG TPA: SpoIIE family protein phosphatase [Bryobacteraceae bacterium]|jgi:serine phosphatase RsbU (regulator of sigma subunit)|nr:SpoIIE family protein phosphatase [Bryobacteraceae bacterium]
MTSPSEPVRATGRLPALAVINPSGNRSRIPLEPLPFTIGRQGDNNLVLRDNRASRAHACIVVENGDYFVEDLNSRHGVFVNGQRVKRHKLTDADRIDFGFQDSYRLVFTLEDDEIRRFMEQLSTQAAAGATNLSKLRSLVEVARALQSSLSTHDVLAAVVDAALSVTGAERGFLLLKNKDELDVSVARDRRGAALGPEDLGVPRSLIHRALRTRRDMLSMTFDPLGEGGIRPEMSVADLELRSVVCVPLIHVRTGSMQDTIATSLNDTVGVLYMDSRQSAADLSVGNREILQTLALEASTILENARLLEEERVKRHLEEELDLARTIQQGLLPNDLPSTGWLRAAGSSITSRQVGGDYFDVHPAGPDSFACVIADVSGKGVSAALLAALLQGAFLLASEGPAQIEDVMSSINRFLTERAKSEKYATVFYCTVDRSGVLRWSNAGHPKPILVRAGCELISLESTGLPLGMLEVASYEVKSMQLQPGDKIVLYSDGLSEAESEDGEFFDRKRFREVLCANAGLGCAEFHSKLVEAVEDFSEGAELADDITTLVLEYQP